MQTDIQSTFLDVNDKSEVMGQLVDSSTVLVRAFGKDGVALLWVDGIRGPQWLRQIADAIESAAKVNVQSETAGVSRE